MTRLQVVAPVLLLSFAAAELVATLPGERLYARHGYVSAGRRSYALPGGGRIDFVPMRRPIGLSHEGLPDAEVP